MAAFTELLKLPIADIVHTILLTSSILIILLGIDAFRSRQRKRSNRVPGLIIPGINGKTRRFLSSPIGKVINQEKYLPLLSVPRKSLCRGSHEGWLVMVDKDMTMYVLNPLSGTRKDLPPVTALPKPRPGDTPLSKWYVDKAILSKSPSYSNCFVLISYGRGELAYCKLGDKTWSFITCPRPWGYIDAIYFMEELYYVVDELGKVYLCDLSVSEPILTKYSSPPKGIPYVQKWYLVESRGQLLHIWRDIDFGVGDDDEEEITARTLKFEVYRQDRITRSGPKWVKVKNLNGEALFLGLNQSFSLSNPHLFGYKENRIYFTDDNVAEHYLSEHSGNDMGVFHLEDSTIAPLYFSNSESTDPPAIWFMPIPRR